MSVQYDSRLGAPHLVRYLKARTQRASIEYLLIIESRSRPVYFGFLLNHAKFQDCCWCQVSRKGNDLSLAKLWLKFGVGWGGGGVRVIFWGLKFWPKVFSLGL